MIKPVYDQDGITIYCADMFDVLPQLAQEGISFVWADPPYGIRSVRTSGALNGRQSLSGSDRMKQPGRLKPAGFGKTREPCPTVPVGHGKQFGTVAGGTAGKTKYIAATVYPVVIGDDSTETAQTAFCACSEAFPRARQVWWGANHYSDVLSSSASWIVWDKVNTADFADAELAWSNHGGAVRICKHMWNGLLKGSERTESRFHPNQKPVYLATWCFDRFGKQDDVILEPFMGSGPGIRAAKRMNRRAIGIELSEEYCEQVIRRLSQGGLELFAEDIP